MSAGFSLHYSVTVDRLLSILHHVFAGVGIGILPSGCLPRSQWGEGFHSALLVEPSLSVTVGLITSRSRYLTPAAAGMVALIREQMATKAKRSRRLRTHRDAATGRGARAPASGVRPSLPAPRIVSSRSTGYQFLFCGSQRPAMFQSATAEPTSRS